jgi:hypothetical protein
MAKLAAEKILAHLKGLEAQMRAGERPLFSVPAIWENAAEHTSNACDLVLTNQRLFGYIYTTFPRERLFLDALELDDITAVSVRQKNFEAVFRELLVSDDKKRVYIRATRKKIEDAYVALHAAIAEHAPATHATLDAEEHESEQASPAGEQGKEHTEPDYSRERVRQPLERSPLGITLLLVGGLLLEIIGVLAWAATGSAQMGLPLCVAGIIAVIVATLSRRQLR